MPLYEYQCQSCDHAFEELVFGNQVVECPECHESQVQRRMSKPAKPQTATADLSMACNPEGPSCGAPWCKKN